MPATDQSTSANTSSQDGTNTADTTGNTDAQNNAETTVTVTTETKPDAEKKFTQSDLDLIVTKRLDEQKRRDEARAADARKAAEQDALVKQGEWQKIAEARQTEIDGLKLQLSQGETNALRAKVAARHKLPEHWIARIAGTTESEMDADAATLAKDMAPPRAPDTENGERRTSGSAVKTVEKRAAELIASGEYAAF